MSSTLTTTKVYQLGQNGVPVLGTPYATLAAAEAAALAEGPGVYDVVELTQLTVTSGTGTPPPGVPVPPADAILVYYQGKFYWAGDWSDISPNYAAPGGITGQNCIGIPKGPSYEYWLPFPGVNAGSPASDGIGVNLAGKTLVTIAFKPSEAGMNPIMGFYTDSTSDVPLGQGVTVNAAKYLVYGTGAVGEWSAYQVPLSDFNIGVPGWVRKFILQEQGQNVAQACNVDLVFFS